jgi:hypothetical protein
MIAYNIMGPDLLVILGIVIAAFVVIAGGIGYLVWFASRKRG